VRKSVVAVLISFGVSGIALADQVILDDLIVDGSVCTGFDCVNGESFGFDTLRLKENNLRIRFFDTSTSASFPSNDWQITANDSANGGANKFSIDDITGGRTPFTVEAGAPSNSLYVESDGDLGLGTSNPVVDLQIVSGNTPTVRLEQNGSSGFAPQTWDMAGNEANFFIRDATNGSTLPFRIFPGAPSNVINIAANGNVGIGTTTPSAKLEVQGNDPGTNSLSIDFDNSSTGILWFFQNDQDESFKISRAASGGAELVLNERQDANGATLLVDGSVQATNVVFSSSRAVKTAFQSVDAKDVLARVTQMPISEWQYRNDRNNIRHLGPVAEDFKSSFDVGGDGSHISMVDANGVALAAIQGLNQKLEDDRIRATDIQAKLLALEVENVELRNQLSELRTMLAKLLDD